MSRAWEPTLPCSRPLPRSKPGVIPTRAHLLAHGQRPTLSPGQISCLILSPTRELALQIQKEAEMLLKNFKTTEFGVQHVIGGTNMSTEEKNLKSKRCDILVATPGRLVDHLNNTVGFAPKLEALQIYVLDERYWFVLATTFIGHRKAFEKDIWRLQPAPTFR